MSWDYDPFSGMEVGVDERTQLFHWHCHNCGAQSPTEWTIVTTLATLFDDWNRHVRTSHRLVPNDTVGWSKL